MNRPETPGYAAATVTLLVMSLFVLGALVGCRQTQTDSGRQYWTMGVPHEIYNAPMLSLHYLSMGTRADARAGVRCVRPPLDPTPPNGTRGSLEKTTTTFPTPEKTW